MKIFKKTLGNTGEEAAAEYLKKNGYKIIGRNYRNKIGEIDIICENKEYLIFVEVKTRSSDKFGTPASAVDKRKQNKIIKVTQYYLMEHETDKSIRFDVIEVYAEPGSGKINKIEHIKDAFWLF